MRIGLACTRDGSAVYFLTSKGHYAYRWLRDRPDLSTFDPAGFVDEAEVGKFFWVDKGDPAFPLLQKLHRKHFSWVVLPRTLILGLADKPGPYWWCQPLRMARHLGYDTGGGRRALRLAECLQALEG